MLIAPKFEVSTRYGRKNHNAEEKYLYLLGDGVLDKKAATAYQFEA